MIELLLLALAIYLLLGGVFALPFLIKGAPAIDPAAKAGSWGFKVMILPGVALFWPLLCKRWFKGELPPEEKSAHRRKQS